MILALDFGNTRIKAGLFQGGWDGLLDTWTFGYEQFAQMASEGAFPLEWSQAKFSGLLSVGRWSLENIQAQMHQQFPDLSMLPLTPGTRTPLSSRYGTPATLGMDRLALANGAWCQAVGRPLIAFSAGTALTWEVVNASGEYLGGGIAPGLRMRLTALHEQTARLPLVSPEGEVRWPGDTTEASIRAGVVLGMATEIEGMAARATKELGPETRVFLTGGDAPLLVNHLQGSIFADSGLVLQGICAIVQHHVPDA